MSSGYMQIDSSVMIGKKHDLSSSSVVSLLNDIDVEYLLSSIARVEDLISEVGVSKFADAISEVILRAKANNDLIGNMNIKQATEILSSVLFPYVDYLSSSTSINEYNMMDVIYYLAFIARYEDLISSIGISKFKDILNTAILKAHRFSELNSSTNIKLKSDLNSSALLPFASYLSASASINEYNFMNVIYFLLQAPVTHVSCEDIQDTYVREARPTLNYGGSNSLITGSSLDGRYRSIFRFNLDPYFAVRNNPDSKLVEVNLVINSFSSPNPNTTIEIYAYNVSWDENTITWASSRFDTIVKIGEFTPSNTGVIKIDFSNYLASKYIQGTHTINFYFKQKNENINYLFQIDSKEGYHPPYIDIGYQSNSWYGYLDKDELSSNSTIRVKNSRDIYATSVFRSAWQKDLPCSALLRLTKNKEIYSEVQIRRSNYEEILGDSNIYQKSDIDSSMFVRRSSYEDIAGSSNLRQKIDIESQVYIVATNSYKKSDSIFRRSDFEDLFSEFNIRKNLDLSSEVIIKTPGNNDISSSALVRKSNFKEIDSDFNLRKSEDNLGDVLIRLPNYINLGSSSLIRRSGYEDITADTFLRRIEDLNSEVIIRSEGVKDINSSVLIGRYGYEDLSSSTFIRRIIELDSSSITRRSNFDDILSSSNLFSKEDLSSEYLLGYRPLFLDGSAVIRRSEINDLNSTSILKQKIDLLSESNFRSKKDIESNVFIRNILDLNSSSILKQTQDILMESIVRQFGSSDLNQDVIIRVFDIFEPDSVVYILGDYYSVLMGNVGIRLKRKLNMDSSVIIETTSRKWIPNVHAQEIFKYQDRKLPRQWNKDLIP